MRIEVGEGPVVLAAGFGSLWVEYHRENRVGRIDPETNKATTLDASVHCTLEIGAGSVWAAEFSSSSLTRIDPATGETSATVEIPDVCGIATNDQQVWGISPALGELWRVDPSTNRVVDKIELEPGIFGATIRGDELWVTGETRGGTLWIVDASTGEIVVEKALEGAEDVLFAHGSAWVYARMANALYRLDPETAEVLGRTDILLPNGIEADDDGLWVTGYGSHLITQLDTEGNVVAEHQVPAINMGNPVIAFGSLWVADLTQNIVLRLDLEQLRSAS